MIASNQTFVTAAYVITWLVLLGYQWRLVRKAAAAGAVSHAAGGSQPEGGR